MEGWGATDMRREWKRLTWGQVENLVRVREGIGIKTKLLHCSGLLLFYMLYILVVLLLVLGRK